MAIKDYTRSKHINIIIHNGVLLRVEAIDCPEADRIAVANGHVYAEAFIREWDNGDQLRLGQDLRVKQQIRLEEQQRLSRVEELATRLSSMSKDDREKYLKGLMEFLTEQEPA